MLCAASKPVNKRVGAASAATCNLSATARIRYPASMLLRILDSRYLLWLLLTLPGVVVLNRYVIGQTFYGEIVHFTGVLATRLLIVTMAATPLRLMFPKARWTVWLMQRRRYLGVATFGYAALHTAVYLARKGPDALAEAVEPGLLTGWLAFAVFTPLAITSNDWFVRRLRRAWKRLHRFVYAAAALTFAHWLLVAFDIVPGLVHLAVLVALEGYRVIRARPSRRAGT
jgi:sulfoxide reductase heme-binding subunit YedZ